MKNGRLRSARIAIILMFIAVHIYFSLIHSAWRDEAQCWVLAKNLTLPELMSDLASEGHPALWFLILRILTRLKFPFVCLPFFTTALICIAVYLFLFKTDFPLPVQLCVLISALFFYYNPVVSRVYALIVLLVISITVCWEKRYEKPILFGLLTALLLQTHVIMAGMGCGLICIMFLKCLRCRMKEKRLLFGTGIAFTSLALLPLELFQRKTVTADVNSKLSVIISGISLSKLRNAVGVLANAIWNLTHHSIRRCLYWLLLLVIFIAVISLFFLIIRRKNNHLIDMLVVSLCGFFGGLFIIVFVYNGTAQMKFTYFLSIVLFAGVIFYHCVNNIWIRRTIAIVVAIMCLGTVPTVKEQLCGDLEGTWTDSRSFQNFAESVLPENSVILVVDHYSVPAAYAYLSDSRPDILFLDISTQKPYKAHFWGKEDPQVSPEQWNKIVNSIDPVYSVFYLDCAPNELLIPEELVSENNLLYTSHGGKDVFRLWKVR